MPSDDKGRSEITERLTELAVKRMSNITPYWATEVNLDESHEHRVDLMGFERAHNAGSEAARVEGGRFICCEVKSCAADYRSGHGLNFWGDENWLVCPREVAEDERLGIRSWVPPKLVLCPDSSWSKLVVKYDMRPGWASATRRRQPASVMLFRLMQRINAMHGMVPQRRTCHVTREPGSDRLYYCDACGSYYESMNNYPYEYCPRCGAKVVRGDD
jgi:hypothetical protein